MTLFSGEDERRISRAIARAEGGTSGEIVAVVCRRSESYPHIPILVAALAALIVPWPIIYLTWVPVQWIYVAQLAVFVLAAVALSPHALRLRFVPASVRRANCHRRAVEQFLAQNLHTTEGRTGVLIFVSIAERYAEVLADRAIDAKVPEGTWQDVVDRLTEALSQGRAADGFVAAIEACAGHLSRHFPPGSADKNELPNHLIVLG